MNRDRPSAPAALRPPASGSRRAPPCCLNRSLDGTGESPPFCSDGRTRAGSPRGRGSRHMGRVKNGKGGRFSSRPDRVTGPSTDMAARQDLAAGDHHQRFGVLLVLPVHGADQAQIVGDRTEVGLSLRKLVPHMAARCKFYLERHGNSVFPSLPVKPFPPCRRRPGRTRFIRAWGRTIPSGSAPPFWHHMIRP